MEKTKVIIQLPFISFAPFVKMVDDTKEKIQIFFSSMYQQVTSSDQSTAGTKMSVRKMKKFFKNSFFIPLAVVLVVVILIIIFVLKSALSHTPASSTNTSSGDKIAIQKPKASQQLNKVFTFPLKDDAGKQISTLKYEIQAAELRDQIIIKGTPATAVQGRTFLILNLKITNDYSKTVQINARDYVRLIVDNSSEKLAADIHNDPVEVQAISTKYTRIGFPINDTDKNLTLQIGEITGPKQTIKLHLK